MKTTTPSQRQGQCLGNAILAAAMAMPCLHAAHAETVPERGLVAYKYLDYQDSQPGTDRVEVKANSVLVKAPFAGKWLFQGTATVDTVSGASPQRWTTVSGASMHDKRHAEDVALTRYFQDDTLTVGANLSVENDYLSRGVSIAGSHSSEDRNTTFNYGFAGNDDHITSQGLDQNKNTLDVMLGVTRVLTSKDIAQLTATYTRGHGYFTDPYKVGDFRPDHKSQSTLLMRWNHFIEGPDATLRLSYRYYGDSWDIRAHSFTAEYVQPLPHGWTVTPMLRVHDQSAANFFVAPGGSSGNPPYRSFDQRMSAFGARSVGIKVAKELNPDWSVDLKYEYYEQRGSWRLFGDGSQGLDPFRAQIIQAGVSRQF